MKFNKKNDDLQTNTMELTSNKSGESIRIDSTSFELADYTLIIRRNGKSFKEKTLIDLENISYTKVRKNANVTLLVLSIFLFLLGGGGAYPLYKYLGYYAFVAVGACALIGLILLILFIVKRNIKITIYMKNGDKIQRTCKKMKLFSKINDFFDELFYIKHRK